MMESMRVARADSRFLAVLAADRGCEGLGMTRFVVVIAALKHCAPKGAYAAFSSGRLLSLLLLLSLAG